MQCEIVVNGERMTVAQGMPLVELLRSRQLVAGQVLVEHNRQPLSPAEVRALTLADGDELQIVRMMAGG